MDIIYQLLIYFEYEHIEDFKPWWMVINEVANRQRGFGPKKPGQVWELVITVTLK